MPEYQLNVVVKVMSETNDAASIFPAERHASRRVGGLAKDTLLYALLLDDLGKESEAKKAGSSPARRRERRIVAIILVINCLRYLDHDGDK